MAPWSHLLIWSWILANFSFDGHKALEGHGKQIAEKTQRMQSFLLREDKSARIYGGDVSNSGLNRHDPRAGVRAHGDSDNFSGGDAAALGKHRHDAVLGVARAADGDCLPSEVGGAFYARVGNQIKSHFVGLEHDPFDGSALERRAHAAATGAAEIHVAAQQGRDRQRAGDDDGFVV